jgi:uncharacterized membrane protein
MIEDIWENKYLIGFVMVILSFILPLYFYPICLTCGVSSWEPETTYRKAMWLILFLIGMGLVGIDLLEDYKKKKELV